MATNNLYHVTQTLSRLLEWGVRGQLFRLGMPSTVTVTTMPPERLDSPVHTLNLYLYHVMEDAHYRNRPPAPGRGFPPVAREPLTLLLYYIVTSHHELNDVFDAEVEQRNFGMAMKTFHDHPVVDDELAIASDAGPAQTVMVPALRGADNRIEIALRPLSPEESLAFWTSEQSANTRLAAYYEVRTVFLEPEPPVGVSGTVLDLGVFVSPGRAPVLDRVSALSHYTPPAATGLPAQTVETSPARATLAPAMSPPVHRLTIEGQRLAGDGSPGAALLTLRHAAWRERVPPVRSAVIDPALNPAWNVVLNERVAQVDIQPSLTIDTATGPMALPVLPGIYALSIQVTQRQTTPAGRVRATQTESNQVGYALGARIDGVDAPDAAGRMGLRLVDLFDLTAAELELQFGIEGVLYEEAAAFTGDPAEDRGRFVREAGGVIRFHPLFDPAVPGAHPVSLQINGAPSQPFWIDTP